MCGVASAPCSPPLVLPCPVLVHLAYCFSPMCSLLLCSLTSLFSPQRFVLPSIPLCFSCVHCFLFKNLSRKCIIVCCWEGAHTTAYVWQSENKLHGVISHLPFHGLWDWIEVIGLPWQVLCWLSHPAGPSWVLSEIHLALVRICKGKLFWFVRKCGALWVFGTGPSICPSSAVIWLA